MVPGIVESLENEEKEAKGLFKRLRSYAVLSLVMDPSEPPNGGSHSTPPLLLDNEIYEFETKTEDVVTNQEYLYFSKKRWLGLKKERFKFKIQELTIDRLEVPGYRKCKAGSKIKVYVPKYLPKQTLT